MEYSKSCHNNAAIVHAPWIELETHSLSVSLASLAMNVYALYSVKKILGEYGEKKVCTNPKMLSLKGIKTCHEIRLYLV